MNQALLVLARDDDLSLQHSSAPTMSLRRRSTMSPSRRNIGTSIQHRCTPFACGPRESVKQALQGEGVRFAQRLGRARFAFHPYNDDADIDLALSCLDLSIIELGVLNPVPKRLAVLA